MRRFPRRRGLWFVSLCTIAAKLRFGGATGPRAVLYIGRLWDDSERHLRVPSERDYLTRVKEAISEKSRYLSSFADLRHDVAPASAAGPRRPWHDA